MATTVGGGFVYTSIVGPQGLDSVSGSGPPSPVLLPGLIGWSLTSGPQQTLSSAGVISGGAWDFINAGGEIYGPSGLTTNSPGGVGPGVDDATGSSLDVSLPSTSWLLTAKMKTATTGACQVTGSGAIANPYSLVLGPGQTPDTCHAIADIQGDGTAQLSILGPDMALNTDYVCFAWYDAILGTLNLQVGTNSPISAVVADSLGPGWHHNIADLFLFAGVDQSNFISLCRLWIGSNARTIAANYLPNLNNGGAGMSDEALAAFTG